MIKINYNKFYFEDNLGNIFYYKMKINFKIYNQGEYTSPKGIYL